MRIGLGFDLHRFQKKRALFLAGVKIPHTHGLLGNSDADVVLHALSDAILGALGKGDIGDYFRDQDSACRGMNSSEIVSFVLKVLRKQKKKIGNIDLTLITDEPRLFSYKKVLVESLTKLLGISARQLNVKLKSQEGVWKPARFAMCTALVLIQ